MNAANKCLNMSVREEKEESVEQSMGPVMCDPRSLIEGTQPQQEEAVKYYGQALLIGAGAGSGKTRVLTRRIAWLLAHGFWAKQHPRHHLHQQGGRGNA